MDENPYKSPETGQRGEPLLSRTMRYAFYGMLILWGGGFLLAITLRALFSAIRK